MYMEHRLKQVIVLNNQLNALNGVQLQHKCSFRYGVQALQYRHYRRL